MQSGRQLTDRTVLRVSGDDHYTFLQDLISNDLSGMKDGAVYAALLSPQGKYLFDFFVVPKDDGVLIDVSTDRAAALLQRLTMYRLRAKVDLSETSLHVFQVFGGKPDRPCVADPRHPELGWRIYTADPTGVLDGMETATEAHWNSLRITYLVPETGAELIADDSYILEMGFERLNGVDFKKGCYVGQEVTARMKHKTDLKKGLARVTVDGHAPVGTPITADGKPAGTLFTTVDGAGLAYLRFDRASGPMLAGDAKINRSG